MARQSVKDILLMVTMVITIASCFISVGYNYRIISDSEQRIAELEEHKLEVSLYESKHTALKDVIDTKLNQNAKEHVEIMGDLKTLDQKVSDIQRKVDKLSFNNKSNEVIPTQVYPDDLYAMYRAWSSYFGYNNSKGL